MFGFFEQPRFIFIENDVNGTDINVNKSISVGDINAASAYTDNDGNRFCVASGQFCMDFNATAARIF